MTPTETGSPQNSQPEKAKIKKKKSKSTPKNSQDGSLNCREGEPFIDKLVKSGNTKQSQTFAKPGSKLKVVGVAKPYKEMVWDIQNYEVTLTDTKGNFSCQLIDLTIGKKKGNRNGCSVSFQIPDDVGDPGPRLIRIKSKDSSPIKFWFERPIEIVSGGAKPLNNQKKNGPKTKPSGQRERQENSAGRKVDSLPFPQCPKAPANANQITAAPVVQRDLNVGQTSPLSSSRKRKCDDSDLELESPCSPKRAKSLQPQPALGSNASLQYNNQQFDLTNNNQQSDLTNNNQQSDLTNNNQHEVPSDFENPPLDSGPTNLRLDSPFGPYFPNTSLQNENQQDCLLYSDFSSDDSFESSVLLECLQKDNQKEFSNVASVENFVAIHQFVGQQHFRQIAPEPR